MVLHGMERMLISAKDASSASKIIRTVGVPMNGISQMRDSLGNFSRIMRNDAAPCQSRTE